MKPREMSAATPSPPETWPEASTPPSRRSRAAAPAVVGRAGYGLARGVAAPRLVVGPRVRRLDRAAGRPVLAGTLVWVATSVSSNPFSRVELDFHFLTAVSTAGYIWKFPRDTPQEVQITADPDRP